MNFGCGGQRTSNTTLQQQLAEPACCFFNMSQPAGSRLVHVNDEGAVSFFSTASSTSYSRQHRSNTAASASFDFFTSVFPFSEAWAWICFVLAPISNCPDFIFPLVLRLPLPVRVSSCESCLQGGCYDSVTYNSSHPLVLTFSRSAVRPSTLLFS